MGETQMVRIARRGEFSPAPRTSVFCGTHLSSGERELSVEKKGGLSELTRQFASTEPGAEFQHSIPYKAWHTLVPVRRPPIPIPHVHPQQKNRKEQPSH